MTLPTVCATLNLADSQCLKSATDTVSHSCVKDAGACNPFYNDFSDSSSHAARSTERSDLPNGFQQCQTGKAGDTLQFMFKDGRGCDMLGDVGDSVVVGGLTYECHPRLESTASCTGNAPGKECVWSVTLPQCPTPPPTPPSIGGGGPIETCADQDPCIDITYTRQSALDLCAEGACEYLVCAQLNLDNPNCRKSASDTVSHTCEKPDDVCNPPYGFTAESISFYSTEVVGVATGSRQCQVANGGTSVQFLFKDGQGCSAGVARGEVPPVFTSPRTGISGMTCEASTTNTASCTGKGNIGRACVWTVPVPSCT